MAGPVIRLPLSPGAPAPGDTVLLLRLRVCPECAGPLVRASACVSCAVCGWGRCG